MIIQLDIPDSLPEGRRSSFKKGIIDALITSIQQHHSATSLEHTPEGHEPYRVQGEEVGRQLVTLISDRYPR